MESMIGTSIKLTPVEIRLCEHVTKVRMKTNVQNNVNEKKITKDQDLEIEIQGYGAELAFCRLFNIFPDTSTHSRSSEEDTGDATLHCGLSVDVKATNYPLGKLLAPIWKSDNIDLYALMVGDFPDYTFKGFMLKDELRQDRRVGTLGHGPTYIAHQHELMELEEVLKKRELSERMYSDLQQAFGW
jgi:hypothetical protein